MFPARQGPFEGFLCLPSLNGLETPCTRGHGTARWPPTGWPGPGSLRGHPRGHTIQPLLPQAEMCPHTRVCTHTHHYAGVYTDIQKPHGAALDSAALGDNPGGLPSQAGKITTPSPWGSGFHSEHPQLTSEIQPRGSHSPNAGRAWGGAWGLCPLPHSPHYFARQPLNAVVSKYLGAGRGQANPAGVRGGSRG